MRYCKLIFICVIDIEEQPLLPCINLYHNLCIEKISYNLVMLLPRNFCGLVLDQLVIFKSEYEGYIICRFTVFSKLFRLCLLSLSVSKVYSMIIYIVHYMYILMLYINLVTYNISFGKSEGILIIFLENNKVCIHVSSFFFSFCA